MTIEERLKEHAHRIDELLATNRQPMRVPAHASSRGSRFPLLFAAAGALVLAVGIGAWVVIDEPADEVIVGPTDASSGADSQPLPGETRSPSREGDSPSSEAAPGTSPVGEAPPRPAAILGQQDEYPAA